MVTGGILSIGSVERGPAAVFLVDGTESWRTAKGLGSGGEEYVYGI